MPLIKGKLVPAPAACAGSQGCWIEPNSRIQIKLIDVSLADAPAVTISETEIPTSSRHKTYFPIDFRILYEASKIKPGHDYSVVVEITQCKSRCVPGKNDPTEPLTWTTVSNVRAIVSPPPLIVEVDRIRKLDKRSRA